MNAHIETYSYAQSLRSLFNSDGQSSIWTSDAFGASHASASHASAYGAVDISLGLLSQSISDLMDDYPIEMDSMQDEQQQPLEFKFPARNTALSVMASFGMDLHQLALTYKIPQEGHANLTTLINKVIKYISPGK
jgi:hypothetical protein